MGTSSKVCLTFTYAKNFANGSFNDVCEELSFTSLVLFTKEAGFIRYSILNFHNRSI
jgi:hypothetical protein